ncbi:hypothetical protein [Massilia sp. METH4]|uniref:hypothetical protein n=1 Tax=Massilia sp. METH4 TaxID=3123041 RepID=UPI0030D1C140
MCGGLYRSRKVKQEIIREYILPQRDEPGRTSRPSLLPEQPQQNAAGDDQSILSKLDGRASPSGSARAPRKAGRKGGMMAGLAAAVVLGGGALAWTMQENDDAGMQVAAAPAQASAAAPAVAPAVIADAPHPEPSAAPAVAQAAPAHDSNVSAATILDEMPGAAGAATAAAVAAGATAVAARPPAAPDGKDGKDELAAFLDKRASGEKSEAAKPDDEEKLAKAAPAKKTQLTRAERKAKAAREKRLAQAAAKKKKPAAKSAPADSDAALLAALLAHSKAAAARENKAPAEQKGCATSGSGTDSGKNKAKGDCKDPRVAEIAG